VKDDTAQGSGAAPIKKRSVYHTKQQKDCRSGQISRLPPTAVHAAHQVICIKGELYVSRELIYVNVYISNFIAFACRYQLSSAGTSKPTSILLKFVSTSSS
jgi:hypothetical protein